MTATINASTSSGVVITPDNSGNILLQYNGVAAPAFSVSKTSATQSITSNTWTKVTFDTEAFDTNNNFASSTFTPTVAGYYQINGVVDIYPSASGTRAAIRIYKNGTAIGYGNDIQISGQVEMGIVVNSLIYMNGSTDYLELYALMTATSPVIQNYGTYFNGCLLRGA